MRVGRVKKLRLGKESQSSRLISIREEGEGNAVEGCETRSCRGGAESRGVAGRCEGVGVGVDSEEKDEEICSQKKHDE